MRRKIIDTLKISADDIRILSAKELQKKYGVALSTAHRWKNDFQEKSEPVDTARVCESADKTLALYLIQSASDALILAKKMIEDKI